MALKKLNTSCKIATALILLNIFASYQNPAVQESVNFYHKRLNMVSTQIQTRGINDPEVLNAMKKVPRHLFVLPEYISYAYQDTPLPLSDGQTISQPYIVAFMTEALDLKSSDKVLEIGTGSGYQAAILAEICDSVFTIEIFESLERRAKNTLGKLKYKNIQTKVGDGYLGWKKHAPFDAIIVSCSPTHVPQALKDQLAEGGRMIIPVDQNKIQHLVVLKKKREKVKEEKVLPVRFVPMINLDLEKY
jgi:protein-L-isoaspartate(D-aspartate) O-methyltransferase